MAKDLVMIPKRIRWWKYLGLAGLVGVAAGGVLAVRGERARNAYTPDEVRNRLHERAQASGSELPPEQPWPGPWAAVHAERAALAGDLLGLSDEQWATESLCQGMSVREVLAHLTASANLDPLRWQLGVMGCGFDFDKFVARSLTGHLGDSPAETLDRFGRAINSTTKPPVKTIAVLGEVVIHGEDIRRPLGIRYDHPMENLTRVADYYLGSNLVLPVKRRVKGLRLIADDGPLNHGSGPLVRGRTIALIMAMAGREAYFDELEGEGVGLLRLRCKRS